MFPTTNSGKFQRFERRARGLAVLSVLSFAPVLPLQAGTIEGQVNRETGGAPVAGCEFDLQDPVTGDIGVPVPDVTDGSGHFVSTCPDGVWNVRFKPAAATHLAGVLVENQSTTGFHNLGTILL